MVEEQNRSILQGRHRRRTRMR